MAAFDDTEAAASDQEQHRHADPDPARQIALDQRDQPRRRLAFDDGFGPGFGFNLFLGCSTRAVNSFQTLVLHPLAQKHDRSDSGRLQVSLGPQRSEKRPSEASCSIHCTSSSTVCPRHRAGPGEHDVSDLPGRVLVFSRRKPLPFRAFAGGDNTRNSPRAGSQSVICAASVNLRTSW